MIKIFFFVIMIVLLVEADTRKECFEQYKAGSITKKELMKCSNISDVPLLKIPQNSILEVKSPPKKSDLKKTIPLNDSEKNKLKSINFIEIDMMGSKRDERFFGVAFKYINRETDEMITWTEGSAIAECQIDKVKYEGARSIKVGKIGYMKKQLIRSSQRLFIPLSTNQCDSCFLQCHINIGSKIFEAHSNVAFLN